MKLQYVKNKISSEMEVYFREYGFSLRKKNFEYIKKNKDSCEIFWIRIHVKTEWFLVTPSVYCAYPQINKLLNSIFERSDSANSPTFGFGIGNEFDHKRGRYNIDNNNSLVGAVSLLKKDFHEIALPWFEKVNSLELLDEFLHPSESDEFLPNSINDISVGLIVAKLVDNPLYEKIVNDYYKFCLSTKNPRIIEELDITKKYLGGI